MKNVGGVGRRINNCVFFGVLLSLWNMKRSLMNCSIRIFEMEIKGSKFQRLKSWSNFATFLANFKVEKQMFSIDKLHALVFV